MPKPTGYPAAKDTILTHIFEKNPKQIDRAIVAAMTGSSISTAGNYLMTLAAEYPENLQYTRGILVIFSSIPQSRLPINVKLQEKEKRIEQVKAKARTLKKNHLSHKDSKRLREEIESLLEEIERI